MTRRWPFLIPFLFMTVGISLSMLRGIFSDETAVIAVFSCMLLSCFLSYTKIYPIFTALFFLFWGLFVLHPWLYPEISQQSIKSNISLTPITIEGVIADRPSVASEGSRLTVQVESIIRRQFSETATGLLMLYVSEGDISLTRGDRIRFISPVSVPRRLGLPGEYDYSRYLSFQGISATGRVASEADIVLIRAAAAPSWQRSLDQRARQLGDAIRAAVPDVQVSSVLTALLIGDQRRIPRDLADAYTRAGVNHILSISGFHVGIIAAFITLMLVWILTRFEYPALRWNVRRIALLIAVPAMVMYLFLTGNAPATARSVIMLTVFAIALFAERERDSINTLLFTAFFLVAINPPTLFDVSFQLSFISLWGILLAVPPIMQRSAAVNSPLLRGMIQFIAVSAAASTVTIVPVLFIFKVASLNGILTNFLIVPLLGYGAVLTGFIALPMIILFPSFSSLLLWPAASLVFISNKFILWCTSLPQFTFHGITAWDMFFFLLFMTCLTFMRCRHYRTVLVGLISLAAVILHIYSSSLADGRLHVTMLSVGQAESVLIQLPDGSNMLVDGGGFLHETGKDFGQRLLAPALGVLHIGRIDTMIATHNHPDHSGGLPYIIRNFPVGRFWSIKNVTADIQVELNKKHVPQRTLAAGDTIMLPGPVNITVLSPPRSVRPVLEGDEASENEQSLVFRLSYRDFSMIFCADAGFEAEERMMTGDIELKSKVIKVGHHGSRYSTSVKFIERVHPRLALISAGAGNRFGLPATRTLELLRSENIPLYRTDRDGTIELVTDGAGWSVTTPYKAE
jgi:competence protein ComEC